MSDLYGDYEPVERTLMGWGPIVRPQPLIKGGCCRCGVPWEEQWNRPALLVVSKGGIAHYGMNDGTTKCGIDATSDAWWWPL